MPFCLLTDPWLPARRASGRLEWIDPPAIAPVGPDPVIAIDWPRADFRVAALEFLIGLLAVACSPTSSRAWHKAYFEPPDEEVLRSSFAPLARVFELDGDGPRFMQDFDDIAGEGNDVSALLIEAPGESTIRKNTDLMVRRGRVKQLARPAAAMALFTLQTYAPAGGAGNRTSLRGGGPLTTLAIPPSGPSPLPLWHLLWANVPIGGTPQPEEFPQIFPWLGPTRVSDKAGRPTTPVDVHPLQAFWGMPRRIRLDFDADSDAICDLSGQRDTIMVRRWRQKPWGTNYENWGSLHPLSPCYQAKPGAEWLYLHPQPGGIGYQHWQGVLSRQPGPLRKVAPVIEEFRSSRVLDIAPRAPWRLLAAGYDMDNMKARGFTESELPVTEPADPAKALEIDALVQALVTASQIVAAMLVRSVRRAQFGDGATVAADAAVLIAIREQFWAATSEPFYDFSSRAAGGKDQAGFRMAWRDLLGRIARVAFHEAACIDSCAAGNPERIVAAYHTLDSALRGFGKDGNELFKTLALPLPVAAKSRRKGNL